MTLVTPRHGSTIAIFQSFTRITTHSLHHFIQHHVRVDLLRLVLAIWTYRRRETDSFERSEVARAEDVRTAYECASIAAEGEGNSI